MAQQVNTQAFLKKWKKYNANTFFRNYYETWYHNVNLALEKNESIPHKKDLDYSKSPNWT